MIYASPRCSEIPELSRIVHMFEKKYGKDFVSAATDLRPESGVNCMVIIFILPRPIGDYCILYITFFSLLSVVCFYNILVFADIVL